MYGTTQTWRAKDVRYVWHPFTQMQGYADADAPIFVRGEGVKLYDSDGKAYYDGVSSIWLNVHGHRNPVLDAALKAQVDQLAHATLLGACNIPAIQLAERLVQLTPAGLEHVFYSEDGAEAVEIAIKMAFQYWRLVGEPERTLFIAMQNAYHGDTIGAVSVGAIPRFHEVFAPLLFKTIRVPYPDADHSTAPTPEACADACLAELERVLAAHAHETAALVVEPLVQGAGGMVMMPDGFLRRMAELCRRYGVLWIADEVAVGFGRTGTLFACEQEGVSPDLMALGKGLTGGYLPLAATLATERIYQAFMAGEDEGDRTFYHGHSYTGNPLACAVALANLDLFEQNDVLADVQRKGEWLAGYLREHFEPLPCVGNVRRRGLIAAIDLVADKATQRPFEPSGRVGRAVTRCALELGLFLRPLGDTLVLMPPLSTTPAELEEMCRVLLRAIIDTVAHSGRPSDDAEVRA